MGALSRTQILNSGKRRYDSKEFEDLGEVRVQSLTEKEAMDYESGRYFKDRYELDPGKIPDNRVELIVLCVVDDDGNRVFKKSDVDELRKLDSSVIDHLYAYCKWHCNRELSVEDHLGNSDGIPEDDTP